MDDKFTLTLISQFLVVLTNMFKMYCFPAETFGFKPLNISDPLLAQYTAALLAYVTKRFDKGLTAWLDTLLLI